MKVVCAIHSVMMVCCCGYQLGCNRSCSISQTVGGTCPKMLYKLSLLSWWENLEKLPSCWNIAMHLVCFGPLGHQPGLSSTTPCRGIREEGGSINQFTIRYLLCEMYSVAAIDIAPIDLALSERLTVRIHASLNNGKISSHAWFIKSASGDSLVT